MYSQVLVKSMASFGIFWLQSITLCVSRRKTSAARSRTLDVERRLFAEREQLGHCLALGNALWAEGTIHPPAHGGDIVQRAR